MRVSFADLTDGHVCETAEEAVALVLEALAELDRSAAPGKCLKLPTSKQILLCRDGQISFAAPPVHATGAECVAEAAALLHTLLAAETSTTEYRVHVPG